jgi:hypothetical protein
MSTSSPQPSNETNSTGKKPSTTEELDRYLDRLTYEEVQKMYAEGRMTKITGRAWVERRMVRHQQEIEVIRAGYLRGAWGLLTAYWKYQKALGLEEPTETPSENRLLEFYRVYIEPFLTKSPPENIRWGYNNPMKPDSTPTSSPSTPGKTSPNTLMWRERSSYLTSRDWLVLETGLESS